MVQKNDPYKNVFFSTCLLFVLVVTAISGEVPGVSPDLKEEIQSGLCGVPFEIPAISLPEFPEGTFNIIEFGAVSNGQIMNTAAINEAIRSCSQAGGGSVIIPAGLWLTGPIVLQSNVNLHLQAGALVAFSPNRNDYPIIKPPKKNFETMSLIYGSNLENIAITGEGIFDGSGENWRPVKKFKTTDSQWRKLLKSDGVINPSGDMWWPSVQALQGERFLDSLDAALPSKKRTADVYLPARDFIRPDLAFLVNCKRILIDGPTFKNSPMWAFHPERCENIIIRNVKINNEWWAQNGDGIDVNSCQNVLIYKCTITAGDDGICMKSNRVAEGPALQNVVIRDCIVYHGHGGFVIGSDTEGGIRNIFVNNCTFIGTDIGLRFKSARDRGGLVENIIIRNIHMKDIVNEAILFSTYYENLGRNDTSYKITENTPIFTKFYLDSIFCMGAKQAISVVGLPEMPINTITIRNSCLSANLGLTAEYARDFTLEKVSIIPTTDPILHLIQCSNFRLNTIGFPETISTFMSLSGKDTQSIWIANTALSSLKKPLLIAKEVDARTVTIE